MPVKNRYGCSAAFNEFQLNAYGRLNMEYADALIREDSYHYLDENYDYNGDYRISGNGDHKLSIDAGEHLLIFDETTLDTSGGSSSSSSGSGGLGSGGSNLNSSGLAGSGSNSPGSTGTVRRNHTTDHASADGIDAKVLSNLGNIRLLESDEVSERIIYTKKDVTFHITVSSKATCE